MCTTYKSSVDELFVPHDGIKFKYDYYLSVRILLYVSLCAGGD